MSHNPETERSATLLLEALAAGFEEWWADQTGGLVFVESTKQFAREAWIGRSALLLTEEVRKTLAPLHRELFQAPALDPVSFVAGAKYWEFTSTGFTMFPSDQRRVYHEALARIERAEAARRTDAGSQIESPVDAPIS